MAKASFAAMARTGRALGDASAWLGRLAAWLILPIIVGAMLAIAGSYFGLSSFARWGVSVPLFGDHFSVTGAAELQWHLFGVMVMLGGAYALRADRHVRVDLVYAKLSPRGRRSVDLIGDLVLLLPYCALVAYLSLGFVEMAYRSGEQSDYGGLIDRYLIKAILPIGLGTLFLAGLGRILENLAALLSGDTSPYGVDEAQGGDSLDQERAQVQEAPSPQPAGVSQGGVSRHDG